MNCLDAENCMKNNATIFNMTASKSKCGRFGKTYKYPRHGFRQFWVKLYAKFLEKIMKKVLEPYNNKL